jgi:hypothetical protein
MAATVKDYIKDKGYSKGDTITNPENDAQSYIVGTRGRCPSWLSALAGVPTKSKSKSANKKAAKAAGAVVSKKAKTAGNFVTLTNGTFYINGESIYVSEDTEIEVPVGAVISGAPTPTK